MASEEKSYSTGEAAKCLGVSFRTLQRWIYSDKISVFKLPNGQYCISDSEIDRLTGIMRKELEELAKTKKEIVDVIKRKSSVFA